MFSAHLRDRSQALKSQNPAETQAVEVAAVRRKLHSGNMRAPASLPLGAALHSCLGVVNGEADSNRR
jgi:hypothetical protein